MEICSLIFLLVLERETKTSNTAIKTQGPSCDSQLDHVLEKEHGKIKMGRITAKWTGLSDHTMLTVPDDKQCDGEKDTIRKEKEGICKSKQNA
jgi:hypothetical protein